MLIFSVSKWLLLRVILMMSMNIIDIHRGVYAR